MAWSAGGREKGNLLERERKLQILKEKGKITNFERERKNYKLRKITRDEKVQISKAFLSKLGYFAVFCLNCLNSIEVTSIHVFLHGFNFLKEIM